MKRKQKQKMEQLSGRQQREQFKKNWFGSSKIEYKYINTMGGYIISIGSDSRPTDVYIARRLHVSVNEYVNLIKEFRCTEYRGVSYFENTDKIDAFLVMLELMR